MGWRLDRVIEVGPLADDDAAQALLDQAPEAGNYSDARALARRLGGLPLAVHLAGAYLESDVALRAVRQTRGTRVGDMDMLVKIAGPTSIWLSWVVNLVAVEWWMQRSRHARGRHLPVARVS